MRTSNGRTRHLSLSVAFGGTFTVVAGSSVTPYGNAGVSDPGINVAYATALEAPAGGHFVDASGNAVSSATGTDAGVTAALHGWRFVADPLANGKAINGVVNTTAVEQNGEISSGRPVYDLGGNNYTVVTPPAITGAKANAAPGAPFASVAVADDVDQNGASSSKVAATITESVNAQTTDAAGKLAGAAETAPGVYQLAATDAASLSKQLNAIAFSGVPGAADQQVQFSLKVTDDHGLSSVDSTTSVAVPGVPTTPQPPQPVANFTVRDVTADQTSSVAGTPYSGPVAGLQTEFVNVSPHNLNVVALSPNVFIHTGAGNDAVQAAGGRNVVDGGTGSNFLSAGDGTDTFFVDDRNAPSDIWSTVTGARGGDDVTVFGVTPSGFALNWADNQGATGYTGLTLHALATGKPTASFTLAGFASADLGNGRVVVSYGANGSEPYMNVRVA